MRLTVPRVPAGFTLIEVLAALVVLAVGLLGLERLMIDGLSGSRIARQHSQAVALAADMGERIRSNGAGAGAYALAVGAEVAPPANDCSTGTPCSPAGVAALDLYRWQQLVRDVLPDAQTSIVTAVVGAGPTRQYDILIRWTQTGDDDPARFALTVQR
jgi:type IV pilus assembly protein PilV